MKKIFLLVATISLISSSIHSCVIYKPSTGKYTVDKNGCTESNK